MKSIVLPSHPNMTFNPMLEVLRSLFLHGGPVTASKVAEKGNVGKTIVGRYLSFLTELGLVNRSRPNIRGSLLYELSKKGRKIATLIYEGNNDEARRKIADSVSKHETYSIITRFLDQKNGVASLTALTTYLISESNRQWKPDSTLPRVRALILIFSELGLLNYDEREDVVKLIDGFRTNSEKVHQVLSEITTGDVRRGVLESDIAEFRFGRLFLRIPLEKSSIAQVKGILEVLEKQLEKK